jgi:hypothetical protein
MIANVVTTPATTEIVLRTMKVVLTVGIGAPPFAIEKGMAAKPL